MFFFLEKLYQLQIFCGRTHEIVDDQHCNISHAQYLVRFCHSFLSYFAVVVDAGGCR